MDQQQMLGQAEDIADKVVIRRDMVFLFQGVLHLILFRLPQTDITAR